MKKLIHSICLLLVCCSSITAQGFKEMVIKASENLSKADRFSYNLLFDNYQSNVLISSEKFSIQKLGDTLYSKNERMESFFFKDISLIVDHEGQLVVLNKGMARQKSMTDTQFTLLTELENLAVNIKKSENKGLIVYELSFLDYHMKKVIVSYNEEKSMIGTITLFLSEPIVYEEQEISIDKMEIKLKDYTTENKVLERSPVSYVKQNGEQVELQEKYSHYQIITNLSLIHI